VISRPFLGYAADRYGRRSVAIPGLLGIGAAMILLAAVQGQAPFLALGILYGLAFSGAHVGFFALTIDRAGIAERGLAVATFGQAFDGGVVIGAIGLGPLADQAGLGAIFLAGGGLALLGGLASPLLTRPLPPESRG